ncbi:MAG: ABC transporter ATP-binding protein [Deltaproteobacteria bacterium]|nr:ABC transporter ATP-binding protein [Deltaproteobacteria bacterium]
MSCMIKAKGIWKVFETKGDKVEALKGIDLVINRGDTLGVIGVSGSGKSTLLHILGTLDRPTGGELIYWDKNVELDGNGHKEQRRELNIFDHSDNELATFRNREIGFVFQFHYLLPEFNALENVMMPGFIQGMTKKQAKELSESVLLKVGLQHRLFHRPGELSGGEQQRVAIARAVVLKPKVIFADEPTGNLDLETGMSILDLFLKLNEEDGIILVLVTHNPQVAKRLGRTIRLSDGSIVDEN